MSYFYTVETPTSEDIKALLESNKDRQRQEMEACAISFETLLKEQLHKAHIEVLTNNKILPGERIDFFTMGLYSDAIKHVKIINRVFSEFEKCFTDLITCKLDYKRQYADKAENEPFVVNVIFNIIKSKEMKDSKK